MTRSSRKAVNPFYFALIVIGIVFTVTACAYGVMTIQQINPSTVRRPHALTTFLDEHGIVVLAVELVLLAFATVAAIGTDGYWTRLNTNHPEQEAMHDESQPR